jgi:hypothetical protein
MFSYNILLLGKMVAVATEFALQESRFLQVGVAGLPRPLLPEWSMVLPGPACVAPQKRRTPESRMSAV